MASSEEGMEEVLPCLEFGVQDSAKKKVKAVQIQS